MGCVMLCEVGEISLYLHVPGAGARRPGSGPVRPAAVARVRPVGGGAGAAARVRTHLRPVKTSRPNMLALAWPCLPVLEMEISMTLQGLSLFMMTCIPLRTSPARMGAVSEAPAPPLLMS